MRTRVCERLGIEFPILAFSHCRDVVAAVTNAGGFGVLGAVAHTPERLDTDLAWIEEQVGAKPYGVDLLLPAKYEGSTEGGLEGRRLRERLPEEHRLFLTEMLERYGVPELPARDGGTRRDGDGPVRAYDDDGAHGLNITPQTVAALLDVAFDHDIRLVASALGPPPPQLVERAHDAGVAVAALAGTAVHAERHKAAGVDLVVAQGGEAGGHTGTLSTMVLVPEVVDAVAPTPVLAAGGIGRGRQLAAALALGADGVWCGSVWLTTEEAETHPAVKEKFLAATAADTVRSRSKTGKPARMLRSAWTDEWERPDTPDPLPMPLQTALIRQAEARIDRAAHRPGGAQQLANYFVGQIVGSMNSVKPARTVVFDMVDEMIDAAQRVQDAMAAD